MTHRTTGLFSLSILVLVLVLVLVPAGPASAQLDPATDPIVLVLDADDRASFALRGGSFVEVDGLVHVNSSDACGLEVNGTPKTPALVAAGTTVVGGACFPEDTIQGALAGGGDVFDDPLATLLPTTVAWDNFKAGLAVQPGDNGTGLIDGSSADPYLPGFYAEGIVVEGPESVTLASGPFIFGGAGIQLHGGARLFGAEDGVTLLVDLGGSVGISGNGAGMQVAARTVGGFAGVAVFSHRGNTGADAFHVSGGGSVDVAGVVYVSGGGVRMSGNPGTRLGAVIAGTVTAEGTPDGRVTGDGLVLPLVQHQAIRVSVKRVHSSATNHAPAFWGDPNGAPGPDPDVRIRDWVAEAGMLLTDRAGVALELVEIVELVDPMKPSSWVFVDVDARPAMRAAALADACRYAWRDDALNVYLAAGAYSGWTGQWNLPCSFPHGTTGDLVVLSPSTRNGGVGLAHEIGHVLGLYHTHEKRFGVEAYVGCGAASPHCGQAGDLVCDTPADPGQAALLHAWYPCQGPYGTLARNVMSRYDGIEAMGAVLTPGQAARLRADLALAHAAILADGSTWDAPCAWTHLGQGLAGSQHVPILAGLGTLEGGKPFAITLDHVLSHTQAALFVGMSEVQAPFRGGVLVPAPQLALALGIGHAGGCALFGTWPPALPAGLTLTFQAWIADPAGDEGCAASNALRATPP